MQVSVEAPSKIERRMTVVIPVDTFDKAYDKRIAHIAKTAKVDGFRPGKVPLDFVRQRFGDSARQEALSEVIQSSLYAAIHQEKLNPVGVPMVEPKTVIAGQPLEFVATFEILPPLEQVKFETKTLEKKTATITEEDIEKVINHLREQHVSWKSVERAAVDKDQVIIDFCGKMDGVPFKGGEAHDYPIILGSKTMIPGFEENLIGLTAGSEKTFPVTFPENYFAKEFAGKAAEFSIKMIKVNEPNLPLLDESLIKKLGVKSGMLEDLKSEIRKNLERELDRLVKGGLKTALFNQLIEQNPMDVPNALIEKEAKRIHDELHPHHKNHEHDHTEAEMASFNIAAKRNIILGLIIAELVKKHDLRRDDARIQEHLQHVAAVYEKPEDVIKWYQNNKKAMAEIEMQVMEEQLTEKLLEGIQITEKMMNYHDLVESFKAESVK